MGETVLWNGIDGETGKPLGGQASLEEIGGVVEERLRGGPPLVQREMPEDDAAALPPYGIDVGDLGATGWAVIFAEGADPAVAEALSPLLARRKEQASRISEWGFRRLDGENGYRKRDSLPRFLERFGIGVGGPVRRDSLPYYLLLVGGPAEIPFEIQYELATDYAVGRLSFPDPDGYARYARAVLAAEENAARAASRRALFFAPSCDALTELSRDLLALRLAEALAGQFPSWTVQTALGEAADKARLLRELVSGPPPALLFTAGHGVVLKRGNPTRSVHQGALLCQGWPGKGPITSAHRFAAEDLPDHADLGGLIAFLFACSSAGTPAQSDFYTLTSRQYLEPETPFLSPLPQRLLAQGALAVIGHVDSLWEESFLYRKEPPDPDLRVFGETLRALLDGLPVGFAFDPFGRRYAALAAGVNNTAFDLRRGLPVDRPALARRWLTANDARNYILLGDPAVKLAAPAG
jgi:hypothetical protein